MNYDIDFRYRRALSPEGLVTYETCLIAVNDAVADAKLAGLDPATDPAVQLLSRRLARFSLGTIESQHDEDQDLRKRCVESLAELKHKPAIVALVLRGMDHRPVELAHYRREGQRTLRQIANELGLDRDRYRLNYLAPTASLAGDHTLESSSIFVRISPERWGEQGVIHTGNHLAMPCAKPRSPCCATSRHSPDASRANSNSRRPARPA